MDDTRHATTDTPVVAVTGVTSGIGHGIATAFSRRGARVVGNGRRRELGERLERDRRAEGGDCTWVPGDVTHPPDAAALVAAAVERHGRLDVTVCNAGTVGPEPLRGVADVDEAFWDQVIDTNLKGSFFTAQAAAPAMAAGGGGVLVLVASGAGARVASDMLVYRTAKAGVIHMGRCLAQALAPDGIRVHTLLMGSVESEGGDRVLDARTRDLDPAAADALRAERARRSVTPLEVGDGIAALVDDPLATPGPNFALA